VESTSRTVVLVSSIFFRSRRGTDEISSNSLRNVVSSGSSVYLVDRDVPLHELAGDLFNDLSLSFRLKSGPLFHKSRYGLTMVCRLRVQR